MESCKLKITFYFWSPRLIVSIEWLEEFLFWFPGRNKLQLTPWMILINHLLDQNGLLFLLFWRHFTELLENASTDAYRLWFCFFIVVQYFKKDYRNKTCWRFIVVSTLSRAQNKVSLEGYKLWFIIFLKSKNPQIPYIFVGLHVYQKMMLNSVPKL